jgi:SHOCT-like domain
MRRNAMSEETRKVLDMLQQGTIGVDEAEKLLAAVSSPGNPGEAAGTDTGSSAGGRKYLRIQVDPEQGSGGDRVNVRVPMKLIRAGLKLAAFLPRDAQSQVNDALREKGFDLDLSKLKPEDLEEVVANLDDLTVDVEGKQKVRIYSE